VFIWGDPIWVNPAEGEVDLEGQRRALENRLNQITDRADRYFDS
jgi:hypothetical protein